MTTLSVRTAPSLAAGLALVSLLTGPASAADPSIQWRADYNSARREAQQKGLPLMVEVGTEECYYCKKQDGTTFRDPGVIALLNARFVTVRVDANREPAFAQALHVQVYPTTVIGSPDGRVLAFLQGYSSAEQLSEALRRAAPAAVAAPEAPETGEPASAADLLAAARQDFRARQYADCLDLCERITARHPDTPEATAAAKLARRLTEDVDRFALACEQRTERTARMLLELADAWEKKGKVKESRECLERVARLSPVGKTGEQAQAKLARMSKVAETISAIEK